jgi:hypothetical protein
MANISDEILKPLRLSCKKIEAGEAADKHLELIKKFASKGAFYQHHVCVELLGVITREPSIPSRTASEIFELIGSIVHDGNGNKDSILCVFYNFVAKLKVI